MKKVTVHTPFVLNKGAEKVNYLQGTYEMPKADADHWYSLKHIEVLEEIEEGVFTEIVETAHEIKPKIRKQK